MAPPFFFSAFFLAFGLRSRFGSGWRKRNPDRPYRRNYNWENCNRRYMTYPPDSLCRTGRLLLLLVSLLPGWQAAAQKKPVCILLSKSYGNGTYESWLTRSDSSLKLVSLWHVRPDSLDYWMDAADGMLITGGEDIYPARYGREQDTSLCGEFDLYRDSLEFAMVARAFERQLPVFGICRGFQLLNIYMGGTLHPDLPQALGMKVIHRDEGPVVHNVQVTPQPGAPVTVPAGTFPVKSNHHQGADKPGDNLIPFAATGDGLTEAFFIRPGTTVLPFLMAVQWHPERMEPDSPLSGPLSRGFVEACRARFRKNR